MKTYKNLKNLFDKICSFENIYLAYLKAIKCKRYRPYVLEFSYNLEGNLFNIQKDLVNLTYKPGPYREFIICDSKKRQIKAPAFRDRIIHHAICNIIEPIFDKIFIFDSYACRKNKGTHRAVKRLEYFIKSLRTRLRERVNPTLKFFVLNATFLNILKIFIMTLFLICFKRKLATGKF